MPTMKDVINMKKIKNKINGAGRLIAMILIMAFVLILVSGCGKKEELSVEEEVERNLEQINEAKTDNASITDKTDKTGLTDEAGSEADPKKISTDDGTSTGKETDKSDADKQTYGKIYVTENPFLGYSSTAVSYDIKFKIQTDSGIAGIIWGLDPKDDDSEYYLWSFDLTREFPRLYTCRRQEENVWDEVYTNLDIMYPEMNMFSGGEHIVEISVDGTKVTTYLDTCPVFETELKEAKPIGRIGTWVMEGDYYAWFDDLNIREGADGSGDYLYVEDFAKKSCILPSKTGTENGRFKAPAGITVIPAAE